MDEFAAYMGPRPSPDHSVDRYPDPYGSYVPGNVRWATYSEQQNNRRFLKERLKRVAPKSNQRAMEKMFEKYPRAEIARWIGISRQAVSQWKEIPPKFVKLLSEKTGIPKSELIPELFD